MQIKEAANQHKQVVNSNEIFPGQVQGGFYGNYLWSCIQ